VKPDVSIERLDVSAYTVPTDQPESDGTLEWDSTTIVVVEARAGAVGGIGYTYGNQSIATLVTSKVADVVRGRDPMDVGAAWTAMHVALRNEGHSGHSMMAMSAVDAALWDVKARLLDVPVVALLPAAHDSVPIYGSGGFTSYSLDRLGEQLGGWVEQGIPRVKLKVGRSPSDDPARLDAARKAIGDDTELYVDANGAFDRKQALDWAHRYRREWNVSWFEEPVTSDDPQGLGLVRDHGPAGMDIAAGEYGYTIAEFLTWIDAVDCLQADVTRCGGITGMLRVAALCASRSIDLSGHCAPSLTMHALSAASHLRHLEYFHDHVRVERMLFDGVLDPRDGALTPDRSRPGLGLELKRADAEAYRVA
jgi:L-alanine-DL-glutamate epimerase-like enolase superfamily enzyme